MTNEKLCPKCKQRPPRPQHSYCRTCHAAYQREWRKKHPQSEEDRRRSLCRAYAWVYVKRGKIQREACLHCGSKDSHMHHDDYTKPLQVIWLCTQCRKDREQEMQDAVTRNARQTQSA